MEHTRARRLAVATFATAGLVLAGSLPAAATVEPSRGVAAVADVTSETGQPAVAMRVTRPVVTADVAAATAASVAARPRGARQQPRSGHPAAAPTVAASQVSALAASAAPAALGKLLANFNGTSSKDSEVTNFNARFEPPDQGLCVGAGFVLEPVNSALPDLQDQRGVRTRTVQRQRDLRRGRQGVHQRPEVLVRPDRPTPGSPPSCSSTTPSPRAVSTSPSTRPMTRPGCGPSTRSTTPSTAERRAEPVRVPLFGDQPRRGSTRTTCTSPRTSSRSTVRSSTAA